MLQPDERLEPLGCGIRIYTNGTHRFGTDAVMLADFASPRKGDTACDLGTGCGIIPLLWCRGSEPADITAVDIQPDAVRLLTESVALNALGDRVTPVCADLRTLGGEHAGGYTLVTMNPPYKRLTGGAISPDDARAVARHEVKCTVADMAECASRLLKSGGRLCVCHRPERLTDLLCAMRSARVEPKRLRLVCQRPGGAPILLLCEGRKDGSPGMAIESPLYIEDDNGAYSPQMKEIYAAYLAAGTETDK